MRIIPSEIHLLYSLPSLSKRSALSTATVGIVMSGQRVTLKLRLSSQGCRVAVSHWTPLAQLVTRRAHSSNAMYSVITLLLISFANAHGEPDPIHVQHRVVHPNLPITQWSELGTVALPSLHSISSFGSPATLIPSNTRLDDLVEFAESVDPTIEGAMYQVALERPGVTDDVWPTSVVKAVSRAGTQNPPPAHVVWLVSPAWIELCTPHHPLLSFRPPLCHRPLRLSSSPRRLVPCSWRKQVVSRTEYDRYTHVATSTASACSFSMYIDSFLMCY